jgi:uncharacterized protein (TIGR03437 family)
MKPSLLFTALLLNLFGAVASAQRPQAALSFNIPVAGWGIPGDQGAHSDSGQLVLTANGVSTVVYFSFAGIDGKDLQTKINFIVATNTGDVLSFLDTSAQLTPTGRSGTATLQFGTGAFHDASAAISYDFTCTSSCFQGLQAPYPLPFAGILKGTGSLYLPTSVAQVILPTIFPPPPGFLQRVENNLATIIGVPIQNKVGNTNFPIGDIARAVGSNGGGQPFLTISPPWQDVASTYSATATCPTIPAGCWITIPTETGALPPFTDTPITADFNSGNLSAGVYPANIALSVAPAGQSSAATIQSLPAMLILNDAPILQVSETGVQFQAAAGGQGALAHTISLSTLGITPVSYHASASTLSGGNWLTVTPASGAASSSSISNVTIAANLTGLDAGTYFGRVDISAPGAVTSLQSVEVELTVAAEPAAVPTFSTAGLIFVAQQNTNAPPQTITLSTLSSQPIAMTSGREDGGMKWLAVSSLSSSLQSSQPISQTVSVNTVGLGLAPGVYSGTVLDEVTASQAIYQIPVYLIVTPASGVCSPTQLVPVLTNLSADFELPAALPVSLQVEILDDCGSTLTAGAVQATFSSGDPAAVMLPIGNGQWSGTWLPHGIAGGPAMVAVSAVSPTGLRGSASAFGTIDANTTVPVVNLDGIVNAASLVHNAPVSPGEFISIFGSNLAPSASGSNSLPLATTLAGTQVLLGGQPLPLDYVSPRQINAVVPYGTSVNGIQQLLVRQNGMYSLPETVVVATTNPGVFTEDSSGLGAGVIVVAKADGTQFNASASQPASAGDALVIYCAGLGPVSPAIADGSGAPTSPHSTTVNPVTVTIGGQPAEVSFAGLSPGYAGLYQVNTVVPAGTTAGANVPVILTVAGFSSAPVTVAIQ